MSAFAPPDGLSNPAGYGGTLIGDAYVQVGGAQNTINNIRTTSWSKSKGLGFQYGPERVWYLFNKVTGCEYGVYGGSTSGMGCSARLRHCHTAPTISRPNKATA